MAKPNRLKTVCRNCYYKEIRGTMIFCHRAQAEFNPETTLSPCATIGAIVYG